MTYEPQTFVERTNWEAQAQLEGSTVISTLNNGEEDVVLNSTAVARVAMNELAGVSAD